VNVPLVIVAPLKSTVERFVGHIEHRGIAAYERRLPVNKVPVDPLLPSFKTVFGYSPLMPPTATQIPTSNESARVPERRFLH